MKKYDVYICYAREDESIVYPFRERLTYDGVKVYKPEDDHDAESVSNAIRDCKVVLYFHTVLAEQSNWIRKELTLAKALKVNTVPVYVSSTANGYAQVEQLLWPSEWITSSLGSMGVPGGFELIVETVKTCLKDYDMSHPDNIKGLQPRSKKNKNALQAIALASMLAFMAVICLALAINIESDWSYGNKAIAVLEIIAFLSVLGLGITMIVMRMPVAHRFYNKSGKYDVTICLDGEEVAQIHPLGMVSIKKRVGHYMLTARANNTTKLDVLSFPVSFNIKTDGSIIELDVESTDKIESLPLPNNNFVTYRCFIGGSTAISNERNAARAALSILYNQYEKYDFYITSHTFEDFKNKHKIDGQQYDYNEFIKFKADCAIFIICNQVGEKTLEEYKLAVETFEDTGEKRPAIFVYNDISYRSKGYIEDASVTAFHKLVDSKNAYWRDYDDIDMLMMKIKEDISAELADILEMRPASIQCEVHR